jgi:hypothetical protein
MINTNLQCYPSQQLHLASIPCLRYTTSMGKLKEPRPRSDAGLLLASFAAAACLGLASCNIQDPLADYYDSTVNLISTGGLDQQNLTTAGYETNAVWTWAWRGATDADDVTGFDYMTLTDQGLVDASGEAAGISASSHVYRLELVNLVAGGDFQGSDLTAWTKDSLADTVLVAVTSGTQIHGQSLKITTAANSWISYNLAALKDYSATNAHDYSLLANCKIVDSYSQFSETFVSGAGGQIPYGSAFRINQTGVLALSMDLFFGSGSINDITIDDFRCYRSDLVSAIRILLRPSDTNPSLINGYYEFSVWARKPSGLFFATEDNAIALADGYASSEVSLFMTNLSKGKGSAQAKFPVVGENWIRLVLRENLYGNMEGIDPTSVVPAMELAIYPCDFQQPSPGVVEIAQPELHFYANAPQQGYFD